MRNLSKIGAGLLILNTACSGNPKSLQSSDPSLLARQVTVSNNLGAILSWNRTLEQSTLEGGAANANANALHQCLIEKPETKEGIVKARANVKELTMGTTYDQCDPHGKQETDRCRAEALSAKHCANEIADIYRDLNYHLETLIACANVKQKKPFPLPIHMDVAENSAITPEQSQDLHFIPCPKKATTFPTDPDKEKWQEEDERVPLGFSPVGKILQDTLNLPDVKVPYKRPGDDSEVIKYSSSPTPSTDKKK